MSESLDRQLGPIEHVKLKLHFIVCAWCVCYLQQIKLLRSTLRSDSEALNPQLPTLSPEACERLRHNLKHTNRS